MIKIAVLIVSVNIVAHKTPFNRGFCETEYKTQL